MGKSYEIQQSDVDVDEESREFALLITFTAAQKGQVPQIEGKRWDGLDLALQVGECTYFVRDNAMGVAGAA